jgi:hypothetical protein
MSVKHIPVVLAASALLVSAAFAQTPTATTDRSNMAPSTTSSSFQGDWRASKVVGLYVYNDNNQNIGSINDLLTDRSGNIKAVVIGVGGFPASARIWSQSRSTRSNSSTSRSPTPVRRATTASRCRQRRRALQPRRRHRSPVRGIRIMLCSTRPGMS